MFLLPDCCSHKAEKFHLTISTCLSTLWIIMRNCSFLRICTLSTFLIMNSLTIFQVRENESKKYNWLL